MQTQIVWRCSLKSNAPCQRASPTAPTGSPDTCNACLGRVRAAVGLADKGFNNLQLIRAAQDNSALAFGALSGGAKEQIAVAMRLAMTKILAADHNGWLPVVLDDAFAGIAK